MDFELEHGTWSPAWPDSIGYELAFDGIRERMTGSGWEAHDGRNSKSVWFATRAEAEAQIEAWDRARREDND